MRRALALCAVLSLAGCQCFDRAYDDYCRDSGRCSDGGADAGASFGNVRRLELNDVAGSPEVGTCTVARVDFRNGLDEVGPAGQSGEVEVVGSPGVSIHEGTSCLPGGLRSRFTFAAGDSSVPFSFKTDRFGPMKITARLGGIEADDNFTATAEVRLTTSHLAVSTSSCSLILDVMAWSNATSGRVMAAAGTAFTITSDELTFGGSCGEEGPSNLPLPGLTSIVALRARMKADAGMGTVTATGDPTAGLLGTASAELYADCLAFGVPCDGGSGGCCGAGSCTAGVCQ